jgi:phosphatidate cytidylyltransferase
MPDHVDSSVLWFVVGLYGLLVFSSLLLLPLKRKLQEKAYQELALRIQSWWIMVTVFAGAMLLSRTISICFFGLLSFLALKEFLSMIPTRRADRRVLLWCYLAIPVQYYWVASEWYGMFIIFIPVYLFLFLPFSMIRIGETRNFLQAAGTLHWGTMTMVFSISHVAFLLTMPKTEIMHAGGAGLVLYLVFLTQINDIAQFCWGKLLGKRKIVPTVSPNKTWEGFIGGVITTSLLALLAGQVLVGMPMWALLFTGALISAAGFVGDVTISALKRDIGVKDSGSMLPGHGGILDRLDSLTYSAPLFFHFIWYMYY